MQFDSQGKALIAKRVVLQFVNRFCSYLLLSAAATLESLNLSGHQENTDRTTCISKNIV